MQVRNFLLKICIYNISSIVIFLNAVKFQTLIECLLCVNYMLKKYEVERNAVPKTERRPGLGTFLSL